MTKYRMIEAFKEHIVQTCFSENLKRKMMFEALKISNKTFYDNLISNLSFKVNSLLMESIIFDYHRLKKEGSLFIVF